MYFTKLPVISVSRISIFLSTQWKISAFNEHSIQHSWTQPTVEDQSGRGQAHGAGMPKGAFGNGTRVWYSQDVSEEKTKGIFPPSK